MAFVSQPGHPVVHCRTPAHHRRGPLGRSRRYRRRALGDIARNRPTKPLVSGTDPRLRRQTVASFPFGGPRAAFGIAAADAPTVARPRRWSCPAGRRAEPLAITFGVTGPTSGSANAPRVPARNTNTEKSRRSVTSPTKHGTGAKSAPALGIAPKTSPSYDTLNPGYRTKRCAGTKGYKNAIKIIPFRDSAIPEPQPGPPAFPTRHNPKSSALE